MDDFPRPTPPPEPRNDADRELIAFGCDPRQIEDFLQLTPAQRLEPLRAWTAFLSKAQRRPAEGAR